MGNCLLNVKSNFLFEKIITCISLQQRVRRVIRAHYNYQKEKKLPRFSHLNPGEIKITNKNHKLHFALVIRGEIPVSTTEVMNNITTVLKVLKSINIKENVCSISIAKSDSIEHVL